ncbi:cell division protein MraZ [bacterium BMS3Abin02]|nr:cell division protein MraZ [bacterium BMS3Abin02]GBE21328.1 cell division protein MraZ [bacterium BMS3Bbin01]HDH24697.1 transcriptional regulator MraZ [Actinomycetota bacterium]HDL49123.1 transcriptional regulator MraZ [Actinomycetota bacterium]
MFLGEYRHTLDPKGRVVLPAEFRAQLADGCVVTKGQERCLYIFPLDRWAEEVERLNRLPRTNRKVRAYTRSVFAGAKKETPDRQGRIVLPERLRDYADLDREAVVVGIADRIEIWNQESWEQLSSEADDIYADIEEEFGTEGI